MNGHRMFSYGAVCCLVVGSVFAVSMPTAAAPVTVTIHHADEFAPLT